MIATEELLIDYTRGCYPAPFAVVCEQSAAPTTTTEATMKITFTGGPYRDAGECYTDFHGLVELLEAGYLVINVEGV